MLLFTLEEIELLYASRRILRNVNTPRATRARALGLADRKEAMPQFGSADGAGSRQQIFSIATAMRDGSMTQGQGKCAAMRACPADWERALIGAFGRLDRQRRAAGI